MATRRSKLTGNNVRYHLSTGITNTKELAKLCNLPEQQISSMKIKYRRDRDLSECLQYSIYMTHSEIAEITGYSRQQIKLIEEEALRKIRDYLSSSNRMKAFEEMKYD